MVWLALVVALVGLLQSGTPPRVAVLSLIVIAITLAISLRWRVAGAAVVVLLLVGIALRMAPASGFSDVLVVTEAAIREMLAGGNPYGHGYAESLPPGAPFAYGPLALLWYLPSLDEPGRLERLAALAVLVLLAIRGRPLGLAVYAVTPAFVVSAADGSNDTTAGLLILAALLVAVRAPVAGSRAAGRGSGLQALCPRLAAGPHRLCRGDRAAAGLRRGFGRAVAAGRARLGTRVAVVVVP